MKCHCHLLLPSNGPYVSVLPSQQVMSSGGQTSPSILSMALFDNTGAPGRWKHCSQAIFAGFIFCACYFQGRGCHVCYFP